MSRLKKIVVFALSLSAVTLCAAESLHSGVAAGKKVSILYLGDSLADFDRGSNHVDRLQAMFDAKNPGKVKIANFAIRGDYIERMMSRMNGKKGTYALARYEGIWDSTYDWAVVSLGHNDTRARSDADYAVPLMSEGQLRAGFRDLIALLKSKGVKRIILRSAASCNFEATSKNAARRLAAINAGKVKKRKNGKMPVATRFGDPKFLEAFNVVMAELAAADPAVEYFDIYTAMKALPDKASYFRRDGVHLSQKGHKYVADVEYAYLGK